MNYQVNIDGQSFDLKEEQLKNLDLVEIGEDFHVLHKHQSYDIKVLKRSVQSKIISLEVNGNLYELTIEDSYDQLVKKMGLSSGNTQKLKSIKAPMPGLILDILVAAGQEISKGTQLVILEAMKMENILKSEGKGIIKSIEIKKGAAVDKGQILIEME